MKRFLQFLILHCLLAGAMPTCMYAMESCPFECFGHTVVIDMTMTIPQMVGPVPTGGNLDVTPFAIAPNGKLFKGDKTNIVPAAGLIQSLNAVSLDKPLEGNYVVGYFVTLGATSPPFSVATIANFSGVLLSVQVGPHKQTITIPVQTIFLSSTSDTNEVLTISANFPIVHHFP
ncbi:MAG: hypothetical protein JSR46_09580 [Verrucomicrobia bacterium]|nr:hypothetical protein [Verrucomicrobiota bacterium]